VKRREFIAAFGGAAAGLPLATGGRAQPDRVRRIGVLTHLSESNPEMQAWLSAFREKLGQLGWQDSRNVQLISRFGERPDRLPVMAKEIVGLQPDVILSHAPPATVALQRETRTIPIVFVAVSDPVGPGFVASLARPGGNLTGFLTFESGIVGKWLAMLKEIAPSLERVALVANPTTTNFDYFLHAAVAAAPSLAIEVVPNRVETADDIERTIGTFAGTPNGGLLLPPDGTVNRNHELIVTLAARHRLPAVYPFRYFATAGGLMSYGIDQSVTYRQAASYVDRILRGERPADLPVQAPTKYETVINLKTAKALELTVPPGMLLAADEVIE
jgi:putative ABC transport system substrate-binding protein